MKRSLLIVEDEVKTASYLRRGLVENGFDVEIARDGGSGLRRALAGDHDLLILDVMLPRRDGWTILAQLRQTGDHRPVLFLTARDAVSNRVKGLELGADDYLVKPFAFSELLARVRSLLRRASSAEGLTIGDLEIDLVHRRALRRRRRLDLTPKEFDLLVALARRKGETLSRPLLEREVWEVHSDSGANVVDVHIRRLRAKIDDPFDSKLIRTVRGVGYVLDESS